MVPSSQGTPQVFTFEAPIHLIESVSPLTVLTDDQFAALYNADPASPTYFTLQLVASLSNTLSMEVLVEHEFDAQFEQPVMVAAS
jgi:hypothetical protein